MKRLLLIGGISGLVVEGLVYLSTDSAATTSSQAAGYLIIVAYLLMVLIALNKITVPKAPKMLWRIGLAVAVVLVAELTRHLLISLLNANLLDAAFALGRLEVMLAQLPVLLGLS